MLGFKFFVVSLAFSLAVPVCAQMIFQDGFANSAASQKNWEIVSGVWKFKDGMLYSEAENDEFVTIYVSTSEWGKDTANDYDEYTIEFKFMKESGAECCRPVWRAIADPLPKTSDERKGFYEWNIGGWSNTRSVVRRFHPNGGAVIVLDSQNNQVKLGATVEVGRWYEVKVTVRNKGKMEGWLDGQKLWELDDHQWTGGRIALLASQMTVFFDDYKVYGAEGLTSGMSVGLSDHVVTTWPNLKTQ